ncbi:MAG: hypothetical protein QOH35_4908, partial [Acidobacteriaceae bacterium]|nr:hypothetical protein [Acidobacteriaceae bacterium]
MYVARAHSSVAIHYTSAPEVQGEAANRFPFSPPTSYINAYWHDTGVGRGREGFGCSFNISATLTLPEVTTHTPAVCAKKRGKTLKILVTGGAGYIGGTVAKRLLDAG